jgi:hypothetical protein
MTTITTTQYANQICYTDVKAHEIVRVISETCIEIRRLRTERNNWTPDYIPGGFSAHCTNDRSQKWTFSSDPGAEVIRIRLSRAKDPSRNGRWFDRAGRKFRVEDMPYEYYDHNF